VELSTPAQIDRFEVVDLLDSLVEKSLVVWDAEAGRYRLLETVRQYGWERMEGAGASDAIRDRHLDYFIDLGQKIEPNLVGEDEQRWYHLLHADQDNINAALDHSGGSDSEKGLALAATIWPHWDRTAQNRFGRDVIERLLKSSDSAPEGRARAAALKCLASIHRRLGNLDEAIARGEQALKIVETIGDRPLAIKILRNLGSYVASLGDTDKAREMYQVLIQWQEGVASDEDLSYSLNNLGVMEFHEGNYTTARNLFDQALRMTKSPRLRGYILSNLSSATLREGQFDQSRKYLSDSWDLVSDQYMQDLFLQVLFAAVELIFDEKRFSLTVQMVGAYRACQESLKCGVEPKDEARLLLVGNQCKVALGEAAFQTEFDAGRKLTIHEAMEMVLAEPPKD
jgi:tetratricopeptide (TPR) repeat protein